MTRSTSRFFMSETGNSKALHQELRSNTLNLEQIMEKMLVLKNVHFTILKKCRMDLDQGISLVGQKYSLPEKSKSMFGVNNAPQRSVSAADCQKLSDRQDLIEIVNAIITNNEKPFTEKDAKVMEKISLSQFSHLREFLTFMQECKAFYYGLCHEISALKKMPDAGRLIKIPACKFYDYTTHVTRMMNATIGQCSIGSAAVFMAMDALGDYCTPVDVFELVFNLKTCLALLTPEERNALKFTWHTIDKVVIDEEINLEYCTKSKQCRVN